MKSNISVGFVLEGAHPRKDGKCSIKLHLYGKSFGQRRYSTKEFATKDEWQKINGKMLRSDDLKKIKAALAAIQQDVKEVVDTIEPFSFIKFEEAYFKQSTSHRNKSHILADIFTCYIEERRALGKIGTVQSYNTTANVVDGFKKNLTIHDITPGFLKSLEKHCIDKGNSYSTVGIYMRQLRAVVNQAIKDKLMSADNYPFKDYKVPSGKSVKKALPNEDLKKLLEYNPQKYSQQKALDYWTLSYLCNGMNFADIINLKKSDLDGNYLSFIRQKTKNTVKERKAIKVGLNSRALALINKLKNIDDANPYLFPVLYPGLAPLTVKHRCQRLIKFVNAEMDTVRQDLKIEQKVGTYVARHSYTSLLMRKGVPVAFLKEALGHRSVATTEAYLGSFEDNAKLEYANLLTDL